MKEKTLLFSVITITYNAEGVLQKTVDSVIGQGYKGLEYIFVDGGSQDKTKQIIEDNICKLNKLGIQTKYISEPDKGISDAFNKGIRLSEGEIIVLLNADDKLLGGALNKISQEMTSDVDIVYGNCLWVDHEHGIQYIRKSKANLKHLMYRMDIMHPATFVRKSMYDKFGLFDVSYRYCMDEELLVRMQMGGARFKYVDYEFSVMQAGGVSDKKVWPVISEGMRIPLKYGNPKFYVTARAIVKLLRHHLAHLYRFKIQKIMQKKQRKWFERN